MRKGKNTAISEKKRSALSSPLGVLLFALPFTLAGGFMLVWLAVIPYLYVMEAKSWVAVPATVESAEVITHAGSEGGSDTYSLQVSYAYTYQSVGYHATRYGFYDSGSDGNRAEKYRQANTLKTTPKQTAYVNPENPSEAVLNRDVSWFRTLMGLGLGSVFFIAGLSTMWHAFRRKEDDDTSHKPTRNAPLSNTARQVKQTPSTYQRSGEPLSPEMGSMKVRLLGIIGVTALWNAITWFFVGSLDSIFSLTGLFLSLFIAVGIALIGGVGYTILAMTNPKILLTLPDPHVAVGDKLTVYWQVTGNVKRLDNLCIRLIGEERATYSRGTDSITDKSIFYEQPVNLSATEIGIAKGSVSFTIPNDTMHSWESDNNAIMWQLHVGSEITRFPNIDETYLITVSPAT